MNLNSIETVLAIILMVILGYILRRINLLKTEDAHALNKIVVNVAIPSLIFLSVYSMNTSDLPGLTFIPLICILVALITGSIAYLWTSMKGYSPQKKWGIILPTAMLNSGFMGYPFSMGLFGSEGLLRAVFYDMGSVLVFIILGIVLILIFGGKLKDILRRFLMFPPLWAIILGLGSNYLHFPLGFVVEDVLYYLSGAAIPLIMISLGLSIEFRGIKENFQDATFVSITRLLISPLMALVVVSIIGLGGLEKTVTILESAMPSAMLSMVLAISYDLDFKTTASCIFLSTLLSMVTLPLILALL
ncbi:AEC family transporter [Methanobacterium alcaliphilum]|uniref:AEC family transporter n=1 Tax=Methanobacterium alcaliphilum TaxID=392018 RepID=UPI00200A052E|nr:AEC family transporter [Methanobacterium alcaliphilum]MCK9151102.1 AEC family transporter [Methanobacterium alcaliphilum]